MNNRENFECKISGIAKTTDHRPVSGTLEAHKHNGTHMKVRIQIYNTMQHKTTISLFLGELTVELNYKINQRKLESRTHNQIKKYKQCIESTTKKEILWGLFGSVYGGWNKSSKP